MSSFASTIASQSPLKINLSGSLNETFDGQALLANTRSKKVVLDVAQMTRITSFGVKQWIKYMTEQEASGGSVIFENLSHAFVTQLNMIANFGGSRSVFRSVAAPMVCESCDWEGTSTVDVSGGNPGDVTAPCPNCGKEAQLDEDPASFFHFLSTAPPAKPAAPAVPSASRPPAGGAVSATAKPPGPTAPNPTAKPAAPIPAAMKAPARESSATPTPKATPARATSRAPEPTPAPVATQAAASLAPTQAPAATPASYAPAPPQMSTDQLIDTLVGAPMDSLGRLGDRLHAFIEPSIRASTRQASREFEKEILERLRNLETGSGSGSDQQQIMVAAGAALALGLIVGTLVGALIFGA